MKSAIHLIAAVAVVTVVIANAAHAGESRYETASDRYIERVIDRYVTAYGSALEGDTKARKRVDLMNRVYPYQIMDKAKVIAAETWGVLLTENESG